MGSYKQDAVPALRHARHLIFWPDAQRPCGSLSYSTRCPEAKYNSFPAVDACAKLTWVRRGLRLTVSLRTGVFFMGDRKTVDFLGGRRTRSEEHTSELQSRENLVCRLLL